MTFNNLASSNVWPGSARPGQESSKQGTARIRRSCKLVHRVSRGINWKSSRLRPGSARRGPGLTKVLPGSARLESQLIAVGLAGYTQGPQDAEAKYSQGFGQGPLCRGSSRVQLGSRYLAWLGCLCFCSGCCRSHYVSKHGHHVALQSHSFCCLRSIP